MKEYEVVYVLKVLNLFTAIISSRFLVKDVLKFKKLYYIDIELKFYLHRIILNEISCQWNIRDYFTEINR